MALLLISASTIAQLPKRIEKEYDLVWQDEFDGEKVDMNKWKYRSTGSKRGIGIVRKKNCYLDGEGHFVIEATREDTNYYIGQMSTQDKFMPKFGYFECSAKMTTQIGPAPAFWLQSPVFGKPVGDTKTAGAEIDIFEYRRNKRLGYVNHTVHWDGYGEHHQQEGVHRKVKNLEEGYHTFGLEWTAKKYTFYVDGKKTWSCRKAPSHIPQYIILSLELNGWGGDPTNSTFPDKVYYDYVRVYEKRATDN